MNKRSEKQSIVAGVLLVCLALLVACVPAQSEEAAVASDQESVAAVMVNPSSLRYAVSPAQQLVSAEIERGLALRRAEAVIVEFAVSPAQQIIKAEIDRGLALRQSETRQE